MTSTDKQTLKLCGTQIDW